MMLSGVLAAVLERSSQYKKFRESFEEAFASENSDIRSTLDDLSGKVREHLEQQFPDTERVKFDLRPPVLDDLLKTFETSIDDGIETTAEEKGDGMQRALMLAIIKTYADFRREQDEFGKSFVFLLDEAELHLHPTAQRQLKEALLTLARNGDQVLLNTHSSVLLADEHQLQQVFKVEKAAGVTMVHPISAPEKPKVIYDLLGGSPADLLFPHNFLIVEGRSDETFISAIISRHYPEPVQPRLQIVFADGDDQRQKKSMDRINMVLVPLHGTPVYKDRLVILCDKPTEARIKDFECFRRSYHDLLSSNQMHILTEEALEMYYPSPWRKTAEETKKMTPSEKMELASHVGNSISLEQFENEMPVIFSALQAAWSKAHK